jgi:hypothetical protein
LCVSITVTQCLHKKHVCVTVTACEVGGAMPPGIWGARMETTRLKMKVGVHEFDAEGPADKVQAQLDQWMTLIATMPAAKAETQPTAAASNARPTITLPVDAIEEVKTRDGLAAPWDIFGWDDADKDLITLRVHPPASEHRDADAILLVMYGYRKAGKDGAGMAEVPVTKLKEALDVSGIRVPRIDRAAAAYLRSGYLLKAGRGKGGIYRLTNTGFAKAEEMARKLFEQLV